jgi:bifunctional non-homologous end joining protein LigD
MNPMPLARLHAPFNHPAWIFEPKLDGFRSLAYIDSGSARLVSRKGNTLKSFPELTRALATAVPAASAILDGEIVRLGPDGKPLFYELMRRRAPQHFYAFDLLWIDGEDLRARPLLERKRRLRNLMTVPGPALYVDHVAGSGVDLFDAVCASDMEGIVAKLAEGRYSPEETSWVKIKNPRYSQAEGRADFFEGRAYRKSA